MTAQPDHEHHDPDTIWVQSWALPKGRGYGVRMTLGERIWGLDRDSAVAYAVAVIGAATEAEHDTAVYRSLTALGLAPEVAAEFLGHDIRPDRPAHPFAGMPLELRPGVAGEPGGGTHPFLGIWLDGEQVGQLDPEAARGHALNVLSVLAAADLDASLRRALVGPVGLDEARASAVIAHLGEHWPGERP